MEKTAILVTGANGEVGHGIIPAISRSGKHEVIALDVSELDPELTPYVKEFTQADILNKEEIKNIIDKNNISIVYHLAAILSTGAEADPIRAHEVNVNGTINLLHLAKEKTIRENIKIKFIFPSSVAVYGMPSLKVKSQSTAVKEHEYLQPITMYGINKLYCEYLGIYYSNYYRGGLTGETKGELDFRSIRFPGIISAITVPTGGTSDYAPEMIHSAAQGEGYESFVRPDTKIPFMVMPDAVKALIMLSEAPEEKLTEQVYNVTGFSTTADSIAQTVNQTFPDSAISYNPNTKRQSIVDSWPEEVDDTKAKNDWGWQPDYDVKRAFEEYLIPTISERYKK